MLVPGMQQRLSVPAFVGPLLLALAAIVIGVAAWGLLSLRSTSNDLPALPLTRPNLTAVAYIAPQGKQDVVYVRSREPGAQPRRLAQFPHAFNVHARGSASPMGDVVAVVSAAGNASASATMTFIRTSDGEITVAGSEFDLLTSFAWTPSGDRVAGQRSTAPNTTGRVSTTIIEVQPATGESLDLATFSDVLLATPVGYSGDGQTLYILTIDQGGSWLWERRDNVLNRMGQLAAGRTRDWKLSPDGTRLAYIEVLGGDRGSVGRTYVFATGNIRTASTSEAQVGVSWKPGSAIPEFGGPGGTIHLDPRPADGTYVIPEEWSPDGSVLVATVFTPAASPVSPAPHTLEIMSATSRLHLAEAANAAFLGWVAE